MKKVTLLIFVVFIGIAVFAQTSSKNDDLKFDADYYLMQREFDKALDIYLKVLRSEPENADVQYRIGICYLNSEDEKEKAIAYFEEAAQHVSEKYNPNSFRETNAPVDALFLLGSSYRVNNQLDKAIAAYHKYKDYLDPKDTYNQQVADQYIRSCDLALVQQQNPQPVIITNLGAPVNNEKPNFNAVLSGDEKTIAYTSTAKQGYEIFTSSFTSGSWSEPVNITVALGTSRKFMKTCDISFDGSRLLLVLEDPVNSDIYSSTLAKGKWSKATAFDKPVNSKWNETHASLSPDGKTMYFTSDRKGGEGDLDIYKTTTGSKGTWEKPVNLGPVVNTPYNEETPFISPDGKTLFFSSEGHEGIGGYDVFRYDFDNPGKSPVNLGYPLNTTDNNLFYFPVGDGNTMCYAMRGADSYGSRDIYLVEIIPPPEVPVEKAATTETTRIQEEEEAPPEEIITAVPESLPPDQQTAEVTVLTPEPAAEENTLTESLPQTTPEPTVLTTYVKMSLELPSGTIARSYTVQFMALRKPVDITYFRNLKDIMITYSDDSWFRYTSTATTDPDEAEQLRKAYLDQGFQDAFIREKSVVPNYTIQLMAVPGPVVDLKTFAGVPEISVTRGSDTFCRYTTGEFETQTDALQMLDQVKKLGYNSAFVRKIRTQ
jgi:Tol biopolymer transport system component